ncbi:DNA-binding response regulator, partial [Streptomyces tendae]
MVRIRVLVVDDHRIFAESLSAPPAAPPPDAVSAAGDGRAEPRRQGQGAPRGRGWERWV